MGKYYTYIITAKIKGILWFYIGKTHNIKARWRAHKWAGTSEDEKFPSYLHRKMYKYGFNLFKLTVIGEFESEKEAFNSEIEWIARLKSNKCRYPKGQGMNLTDGGEGATGAIKSAETLLKLSIANKGKKRSPEICKKFSETMLKYYSHPENKHSPETIEKIRQSNLGRVNSVQSRSKQSNSLKQVWMLSPEVFLTDKALAAKDRTMRERGRPVIVTDENGIENEYPSVNNACTMLGLQNGNAYHVLSGKRLDTLGYRIRYKDKK